MFYGEEDSTFQNLPPEIIIEVLNPVDIKGKQSARLVCRRWRWILDHPGSRLVCFKHKKEEMTEDSIQCLLKTQVHIDRLVLEDVKVTWPSMTYSRNKFPHIQKLTVGSGNSHQSLMTFLQYGCVQTEILKLNNCCFTGVRLNLLSGVLSEMRWNQMTKLRIKVDADAWEIGDPSIELIFKKAKIPNLRALSLYLSSTEEDRVSTAFTKLMSSFVICIEHHSKTLKELQLEIDLDIYSGREGKFIFQNTSGPLFSVEQQTTIGRDLKLERLVISTSHFDALLHLVPPCVWESENLTKFTWSPLRIESDSNPPPGTANPMQELIHRNRNTLTNVTTTFLYGDIDVDPFQLSWLGSCPRFRELNINNISDEFLGVKLQLPTVMKLEIGFIVDFKSIENLSIWISRTFRNLETVKISVCLTVAQHWEFDWIQNMLLLPRLEEIQVRFAYFGLEKSDLPFTAQNLIRQYCSDKARLIFRGERQRENPEQLLPSWPCAIKILPILNQN